MTEETHVSDEAIKWRLTGSAVNLLELRDEIATSDLPGVSAGKVLSVSGDSRHLGNAELASLAISIASGSVVVALDHLIDAARDRGRINKELLPEKSGSKKSGSKKSGSKKSGSKKSGSKKK